MNCLNPEHLLQFGIKAVQDLAESAHYLYATIKAYDFQCIPPHDNVQGGVYQALPRMGQAMRECLFWKTGCARLSGTNMSTASL